MHQNPPQTTVVFMGTPAFAVPTLEALLEGPYHVRGVFTQKPKPQGRGLATQASPVHQLAKAHQLPVWTPQRFDAEALNVLTGLAPDLILVAAYGFLLPKAVLTLPPLGCINVHASLLPRWRGAAPVHHALLAGDTETGITLMYMDQGMDTGDMIATQTVPILPHTTAATLTHNLALAGKDLLTHVLPTIIQKENARTPQPTHGITYAPKITPQDYLIDWRQPAAFIERQIRTFSPKTFFTTKDGKRFRVLTATVHPQPHAKKPGTLMQDPLCVACGEGALTLDELQPEGKKKAGGASIARGYAHYFSQGAVLPTDNLSKTSINGSKKAFHGTLFL
ncbi:methionyl-tRNA formyltransferase [bacterium NHP-B]|nr:methionyl-tRNA formyltransferase [bacterium NHP-B]